jgi:hypothetical protein
MSPAKFQLMFTSGGGGVVVTRFYLLNNTKIISKKLQDFCSY